MSAPERINFRASNKILFHSYYWNVLIHASSILCLYRLILNFQVGTKKFWSNLRIKWREYRQGSMIIKFIQKVAAIRCSISKPAVKNLRMLYEALMLVFIIFLPVLRDWVLLTVMLIFHLIFFSSAASFFPKMFLRYLGFICLLLISAVCSAGYGSGWTSLAEMLNGVCIAFLAGRTLSPEYTQKIIRYLVASSGIWMISGFWQRWAGIAIPMAWVEPVQKDIITTRIFSVFGNPNIYVIYLVSVVILASHLLVETKRLGSRWTYGIVLGMALFSIYLTYSRGGWIIIGVYLLYWSLKTIPKKWMGWGVLIGLSLFCYFQSEFLIRLRSLWEGPHNTLVYRFHIWKSLIRAIPDFWLWGAGPGSFPRVYPWYQVGNIFAEHAHQWYLQFWLEYGFLSLLGFILLIRSSFFSRWDTDGPGRSVSIAVFSLLVFGLAETWYVHSFLGGYFWLLIGLNSSLGRVKDEPGIYVVSGSGGSGGID